MRRLYSTLILGLALSGCAADRPPDEITDDGLVRVPSRSAGGVYRAPEARFTQYQRIILEPPSISFIAKWADKHPEVDKAERARIRSEAVKLFVTSLHASSSSAVHTSSPRIRRPMCCW